MTTLTWAIPEESICVSQVFSKTFESLKRKFRCSMRIGRVGAMFNTPTMGVPKNHTNLRRCSTLPAVPSNKNHQRIVIFSLLCKFADVFYDILWGRSQPRWWCARVGDSAGRYAFSVGMKAPCLRNQLLLHSGYAVCCCTYPS